MLELREWDLVLCCVLVGAMGRGEEGREGSELDSNEGVD